jgi:hypothetical protein
MATGSHDNHGHTLAAWTAVAIMLVGFCVGAVGVVLAEVWLFFVGIGIIVLGGIVGKVMQMMGLGQGPGYQQEEAERRAGDEPHAVT